MDTTGTFEMAKELYLYDMMTAIHKFNTLKEWKEFIKNNYIKKMENSIIPTVGLKESDSIENLFNLLKENNIDNKFLMIDVANGYTERFVNFIKIMREEYPETTIIAGNVATPEAVEALIFAGTDVVKIGIGPSKVCDTRIKTGVGIPQLTATMECADAAHGLNAHVMADGGCKTPADIVKAFGAGADFVMLGSMLAGHDESGGDLITKWRRGDEVIKDIDGDHLGYLDVEEKYKEVYGMSSEHAMEKHFGKKDDYRASEGNYSLVPYKGPVKNTIEDILGGLRSACTYVGAQQLKHLSKCTTFIRVNRIK
jgi:GMP reductase